MTTLQEMLNELESEWNLARQREPSSNPYNLPLGIHESVPFEDYCRIPAVNQSSLSAMKRSPAHYRYAAPQEPTPALRFGTIFHDGHLEPDLLATKYVVVPEETFVQQVQAQASREGREPYASPKATKAYKTLVSHYLSTHPGKQQVSLQWFSDLAAMIRRLNANSRAKELFRVGIPEVTILWTDRKTGLKCKGRVDWVSLASNTLVDLKSTEDAVNWTLDKWDYHIQAAFYLDGYHRARQHLSYRHRKSWPTIPPVSKNFEFCVCEKSPPHTCRVAPVSPSALLHGQREYQHLLSLIADCMSREQWPAAPNPDAWEVSRWFEPLSYPTAPEWE